jgi:outer membrane receptor protein involved in Fe transport
LLKVVPRKVLILLTIAFCVCWGATQTFGQGIVTGSLSGTIFDPQGGVIAGAKVTAKNMDTNVEVSLSSNEVGYFSFRSMPVGMYSVSVEAPSFSLYEAKGVGVAVAKDTVLSIVLTIGKGTETITVSSEVPLIESSTSQLTTVFDSNKVGVLPLGTGFDQLANFVPGVVAPGAVGFGNNNGAQIVANGQRSRSNNFQIDGQANNDNSVTGPSLQLNNPDSVAEFQLITNPTAEYGRNSGAQVNIVTQSGTNPFHGSARYNYRSHTFDSLTRQEQKVGQTRPSRDINNQFGGALGGPIVRDKMWFFGSTYWIRIRQGEGLFNAGPNQLTPTANGLTQLAAAFPGNVGVAVLQALAPATKQLGTTKFNNLQTLLVTNGVGARVPVEFGEIQRSVASPVDDKQHLGRFDWQVTNKDRIFVRYLYDNTLNSLASSLGNGFIAGYVADVPAITHQAGVDWTRTLTSRLTNQARLSYLRANVDFTGGSLGCGVGSINQCAPSILFGTSTSPTATGSVRFTQVNVGPSNTAPQNRLVNNTQFQDNASWVRGKFTIKFGGEYDRQRSPSVFLPNTNGGYVFTASGTFSSFDNLLRNAPAQFSLTDGTSKFNFKEQDTALYVQTDWRVKSNLTLNLGVRWEYSTPAFDLLHDITAQQQASSKPFWDPSLPLDRTTIPNVQQNYHNFGPVVGFAWTPRIWQGVFGANKTVLRGGFRLAYDSIYYNPFLNTATSAPVVNAGQLSVAAGDTVPGLPTAGFTGNDVRAQNLQFIRAGVGQDPGFRTQTLIDPKLSQPYAEEWSFGVQREVTSKVAFEVRYVGNRGVNLLRSVNGNPALNVYLNNGLANLIPAGLQPCTNATGGLNGAAPPGFASGYVDCFRRNVFLRNNGASSNYNSLQSRLDLRTFHNFTGSFNYTYSKTMDTISDVFNTAAVGSLAIGPNPFDPETTEHALSSFDSPHVFSAVALYDLPFYRNQPGLLGHVLGGWSTNLTYRYQTGVPWTPTQTKQTNGAAGNLCDPTNTLSAATDACRPFVGNPNAPFTNVGQVVSIGGQLQLVDANTGLPTSKDQVRYIVNNLNSVKFLGLSPFQGVGRNTERSDYISAVNMSVIKDTKIKERLTLQFQAIAYNLLNRQFLGTPGVSISSPTTFGNFSANDNGGANSATGGSASALVTGVGRRRLEFGLRLSF